MLTSSTPLMHKLLHTHRFIHNLKFFGSLSYLHDLNQGYFAAYNMHPGYSRIDRSTGQSPHYMMS